MKTKIRTYGIKVYTIAHGLNMSEDSAEYKSFAIIRIGSLLLWEQILPTNIFRWPCL